MNILRAWIVAVILQVMLVGCSTAPRGASPYIPADAALRNPLRAQELTLEAVDCMEADETKAQRLLVEALGHDLFHGPAHNNLGVLYLRQDRLYEAANEFEWARKLMPGHPDPRMNLALTMERAGRVEEAIAGYDAALEVYPDHIPSLQALTRCQLRFNRADERTGPMLQLIALQGETGQWRQWALGQSLRLEARSAVD